jgi:hypothetical protein
MTFVSPRDGYFEARKGYEAECRENDRQPNWAYFDKMMIGLLGGTTPTPTPAVVEEPTEYLETPWPTDADAPDGAAPPPPPSERPPDPSGLLSKAIGITRSRMEDSQ